MSRTKDLKPPAELVDAINLSEDMTAPSSAVVEDFAGDVPRQIRNRLVHEEPQKLVGKGEEGDQPSKQDKKLKHEEVHHMMEKEAKYDRSHPGAGKSGRGDQAISSPAAIIGNARGGQ